MKQRKRRTWVRAAVSVLLVLVMVCTSAVAALAAVPGSSAPARSAPQGRAATAEKLTAQEKSTEQLIGDALAMNRSAVDALKQQKVYRDFLDTVAARQRTWVRAEVSRMTKVLKGMGVSPQSTVKELKASENPEARALYKDICKWLVEATEYENCKSSVLESLEKLGLDYIDLVLLHQPFSDYYGAYRALEELYEEGLVKSIGVSNFYPDRLSDICLFGRKVIPAVNQVETNPFNAQYLAQANMEKNGVQMSAWAPFAEGREGIFENETLVKIGKKHGKTSAQVILRWLVDRSIIVLAKSTHKERMAKNIDVFDFALDEEDMLEIMELDKSESMFLDHMDPETVESFDEIVDSGKNKIDS